MCGLIIKQLLPAEFITQRYRVDPCRGSGIYGEGVDPYVPPLLCETQPVPRVRGAIDYQSVGTKHHSKGGASTMIGEA